MKIGGRTCFVHVHMRVKWKLPRERTLSSLARLGPGSLYIIKDSWHRNGRTDAHTSWQHNTVQLRRYGVEIRMFSPFVLEFVVRGFTPSPVVLDCIPVGSVEVPRPSIKSYTWADIRGEPLPLGMFRYDVNTRSGQLSLNLVDVDLEGRYGCYAFGTDGRAKKYIHSLVCGYSRHIPCSMWTPLRVPCMWIHPLPSVSINPFPCTCIHQFPCIWIHRSLACGYVLFPVCIRPRSLVLGYTHSPAYWHTCIYQLPLNDDIPTLLYAFKIVLTPKIKYKKIT